METNNLEYIRNTIGCYFNQDFSCFYNTINDAIYDIFLDTQKEGLILIAEEINLLIKMTKNEENLAFFLINKFQIEVDPKGFGFKSYTVFLEYIRDNIIKYLQEGINDPRYFYKKIKLKYLKKIYTSYFSENPIIKFKNIDEVLEYILSHYSFEEIGSIGPEIDLLQRMTKTEENLDDFLKTEFHVNVVPQEWGTHLNSHFDLLNYIVEKTSEYIQRTLIARER